MHQTGILVIGGGIAGTATACYLAQYGHQVTLLEQSELAAEASGLNAGTLWATGWGHTPELSSTLSMGSLEVFKTLQLDLGHDLEFRQGGSLQAIQTEEEYAFAQQAVRELLARGHQVELLDGRDARSIEPALGPRILGCLYYPHGGSANPVKTVRALASLAQKHGATILTHHKVTGIAHLDDGAYQIITPPATFKASALVLAAGPWCRSLGAMLGLSIPVYAVRGQMWATAPVPPSIYHSIGALESHLYWHTHPYSRASGSPATSTGGRPATVKSSSAATGNWTPPKRPTGTASRPTALMRLNSFQSCRTSPSLAPGPVGCPLHAICTPSSARSPTSKISTYSQA